MLAGLQGVTHGELASTSNLVNLILFSLAVSVDYNKFQPSGQGILAFSAPDYMRLALQETKKITFTGSEKITSSVTTDPLRINMRRLRGAKGRVEALNRGLLGMGASAGFPAGKTVTVVGFPGKWTVDTFMPYLQGFQLARNQAETDSVLQVPL